MSDPQDGRSGPEDPAYGNGAPDTGLPDWPAPTAPVPSGDDAPQNPYGAPTPYVPPAPWPVPPQQTPPQPPPTPGQPTPAPPYAQPAPNAYAPPAYGQPAAQPGQPVYGQPAYDQQTSSAPPTAGGYGAPTQAPDGPPGASQPSPGYTGAPPVAPGYSAYPGYPGYPPYPGVEPTGGTTDGLAITGFVLSFVTSFIGLILSVVAFVRVGRTGRKGRGLALAGIIVGSATTLLAITVSVTLVTTTLVGSPAGFTDHLPTRSAPSGAYQTLAEHNWSPDQGTSGDAFIAVASIDSNGSAYDSPDGSCWVNILAFRPSSPDPRASLAETNDRLRSTLKKDGVTILGMGSGSLKTFRRGAGEPDGSFGTGLARYTATFDGKHYAALTWARELGDSEGSVDTWVELFCGTSAQLKRAAPVVSAEVGTAY